MIIMAIHSSNCGCAAAISDNANIIASNYSIEASMQAEQLLPMIQQTITEANLRYADINYLAVTRGPGSFTGIRIALATALGIITAAPHITPIAISDFEVINFLVKQQVKDIDNTFAVISAYHRNIYLQHFGIHGAAQPLMLNDIEIANLILDASIATKNAVACAGNGLKTIYNQIISTCNTQVIDNIFFLPRFACYDARPICRLAYHMVSSKHPYSTELTPLYVYNREFKQWQPDPSIIQKMT